MKQRKQSIPPLVLEVLRFCVVLFTSAAGYQVGQGFPVTHLGVFTPTSLGLVLGATCGYVLGGVVARSASRSVALAESALAGKSAEQLLAGVVGAIVGVLASAALAWPLLLVASLAFMVPLFFFILITIGSLGYRLGVMRRAGVLEMLGGRGTLHTAPSPSALPAIMDTSIAVDGRIVDIVRAGFFHGLIWIPQPVLGELQALADHSDELKRAKGRRGLDLLERLRQERTIDIEVIPDEAPDAQEVDAKLVQMCLARQAALLTLDSNLAKVAAVAGCQVMNVHALALALRPPVAVGDRITVRLTRVGREPKQGVGHLDDGTMVVVERAAKQVGREVAVKVVSVVITANGRMVFAHPVAQPGGVLPPVVPDPRAVKIAARIAAARSSGEASP